MSSRNQYLTTDERRTAPVIHATLLTIAHELKGGARNYEGLEQAGMQALQAHGFVPQYVAIRTRDLQPPSSENKDLVVLVAAFIGKTRLIDNLPVAL